MIQTEVMGLHMIVKNEEALLPALLAHMSRWVHEMVIVDTGSTDRTFEIARQWTPLAYRHDLDMDFSAARNYALERASTPWILQVDADEWPTEELLRWIEEALVRGFLAPYEGVWVTRENLVAGQGIGTNTLEHHVRMFRRKYRFTGRIHESVGVPVTRLISAPSDFFLLHHKTQARQEMQNERYEAWEEQRIVTQAGRV